MKILITIGAIIMIGAAFAFLMPDEAKALLSSDTAVEWEHGYRTSRVIATRYNGDMGWNIGFEFPKNPGDCDRAELSDFMEAHNGGVFQSGGYPGAEMYVVFKDVKDKESANRKIREILPALNKLITDLGDGKKVVIAKPKPEYEWPDTAPPDKTDKYWEFNNNLSVNGTQYKKAEVSPGKWQWVIDEEAMRSIAEHEDHRRKLFWALRSRVLTDAEMQEVKQYGDTLNIEPMVPFREEDKARELNEALLQQQRLRLAKASADNR